MSDHPEKATPPSAPEDTEDVVPKDIARRRLVLGGLGFAALSYAGAIAYPLYRFLADPAEKAAALAAVTEVELPEGDLPAVGQAHMFAFGIQPAILLQPKEGQFVAFSAVCTHLGCTVQFQPEENRIYCACHGGVYDAATGQNVSGPPPRPLTEFRVEKADGKIIVRRG